MQKRKIIILIVLILAFIFFYFNFPVKLKKTATKTYLNYGTKTIYEKNNNYPKTVIAIPELKGYLIAVYKDAHKLKLYKDNEIIKEYDVNLRNEEEDRKIWEDSQTPEGIFKIETMDIVTNGWERWMRLDTLDKARKIYKENYNDGERRINDFENQYGKINNDEDIRKFNNLNEDEKMLRGVGIHGGGFSLYHDWTDGCMGMASDDVIELFDLISESENKGIGTAVIIQD